MITKSRKKQWLKLFFFLIFLCGLILFWDYANKEKYFRSRFYPQISIDQVEVGGKTPSEIITRYNQKFAKLKDLRITVLYESRPIATYSGQQLAIHTDIKTVTDRAYLIGRGGNLWSKIYQRLSSFWKVNCHDFHTAIEYNCTPINELIIRTEERFNQPAQNARFIFLDGRVTSFHPEKKGLLMLSDEFRARMDGQLQTLTKNVLDLQIDYLSRPILPEITLAQANNFGVEELIGEGRSDFSHSAPERIHNIILAAAKFDGVLILKDRVFSFNNIVGDISSSTGYQPAYIIKQGKTVLGDGGGVCQVSTTLFRAGLNAGLSIVERHAHAYRVSYYENDSKPGFDATVFSPTADLKIANNTLAAILIQTEVDKNNLLLTFKLYGKKDGRKVEISPVTIYDIQPPPDPLYQEDPNLKKGTTKQIDFSAWGAKVNFRYKVSLPDGMAYENNFFSNYQPWRAVYLVGQAG